MFLSTLSNLAHDTTNSESKWAASWLTQKLVPTKSNILFILFIITVCVRDVLWVWVCTFHSASVEIKGQVPGGGSPLSPWDLGIVLKLSGGPTAPLTAEPSHPSTIWFIKESSEGDWRLVQFIKSLFCKHEDRVCFWMPSIHVKTRLQWHKSVTTS